MRTSKPISTISYNSEPFLRAKLEALQKAKKVQYWAYIPHAGEVDKDTGNIDKNHSHVYIEPNVLLDTMQLSEYFEEFDPTHPDKPLGCPIWRNSSAEDWHLYVVHDEEYLKFCKPGECGKQYHYTQDDVRASNEDVKTQVFYSAYHAGKFGTFRATAERLKTAPLSELAMQGFVSPGNSIQLMAFSKALCGQGDMMYNALNASRSNQKALGGVDKAQGVQEGVEQVKKPEKRCKAERANISAASPSSASVAKPTAPVFFQMDISDYDLPFQD